MTLYITSSYSSSRFYGNGQTTILNNGYKTLSIESVSSANYVTLYVYGDNTTIWSGSSGSNLSFDISSYSSIRFYIGRGNDVDPAAIGTVTNIVFSK